MPAPALQPLLPDLPPPEPHRHPSIVEASIYEDRDPLPYKTTASYKALLRFSNILETSEVYTAHMRDVNVQKCLLSDAEGRRLAVALTRPDRLRNLRLAFASGIGKENR